MRARPAYCSALRTYMILHCGVKPFFNPNPSGLRSVLKYLHMYSLVYFSANRLTKQQITTSPQRLAPSATASLPTRLPCRLSNCWTREKGTSKRFYSSTATCWMCSSWKAWPLAALPLQYPQGTRHHCHVSIWRSDELLRIVCFPHPARVGPRTTLLINDACASGVRILYVFTF